jgi:hypothetical protein
MSTLPYVLQSPATPLSVSRERVVFMRMFLQSRPPPLPSLLSTTLVSPAGRERRLSVSHGLRSLFPYFSLVFPYFTLVNHLFPFVLALSSKFRRPPRCQSRLVPTSARCRLLPECRHPSSPNMLRRVQLARSCPAPSPTRARCEIAFPSQGPRKSTCQDTPMVSTLGAPNATTRAASAAPTGQFTQMPPVPVPAVSEDAPGGGWAVSPQALYM